MDTDAVLGALAPPQRLALAYAPRAARTLFLALMALDARLAGIIRSSREPILGQLRLAWWRDQVARPGEERARGDAVLDLVGAWQAEAGALAGLIDGWEHMLGAPPLGRDALASLAEGRALAFAALARLLGLAGECDEAARAGRGWAAADLAAHLRRPDEVEAARELAQSQDWRRPALSRPLRPLAVLFGLARAAPAGEGLLGGPRSLALALRLGLFGR